MESDMADEAGTGVRPTRERLNRLRRSTSALLDRLSTGATPFDITDIEAEEAPPMADDEFDDAERGAQIPKLRSFAVMMRSIDVAQAALARHQMAAYPPDVLIEVPRTACRSLDFHRATELIDLGHELAARALDRIDPEGSD
jgi:NTE family protein